MVARQSAGGHAALHCQRRAAVHYLDAREEAQFGLDVFLDDERAFGGVAQEALGFCGVAQDGGVSGAAAAIGLDDARVGKRCAFDGVRFGAGEHRGHVEARCAERFCGGLLVHLEAVRAAAVEHGDARGLGGFDQVRHARERGVVVAEPRAGEHAADQQAASEGALDGVGCLHVDQRDAGVAAFVGERVAQLARQLVVGPFVRLVQDADGGGVRVAGCAWRSVGGRLDASSVCWASVTVGAWRHGLLCFSPCRVLGHTGVSDTIL